MYAQGSEISFGYHKNPRCARTENNAPHVTYSNTMAITFFLHVHDYVLFEFANSNAFYST